MCVAFDSFIGCTLLNILLGLALKFWRSGLILKYINIYINIYLYIFEVWADTQIYFYIYIYTKFGNQKISFIGCLVGSTYFSIIFSHILSPNIPPCL